MERELSVGVNVDLIWNKVKISANYFITFIHRIFVVVRLLMVEISHILSIICVSSLSFMLAEEISCLSFLPPFIPICFILLVRQTHTTYETLFNYRYEALNECRLSFIADKNDSGRSQKSHQMIKRGKLCFCFPLTRIANCRRKMFFPFQILESFFFSQIELMSSKREENFHSHEYLCISTEEKIYWKYLTANGCFVFSGTCFYSLHGSMYSR